VRSRAINLLGSRFLTDFYTMVDRWTEWATTIVEAWPDHLRQAELDRTEQQEAVSLAESIAAITR